MNSVTSSYCLMTSLYMFDSKRSELLITWLSYSKKLLVVCFFIFLIPFSMIEAYPIGAVRHRMILTLMMLPIFSCVLPNNYISFSEDK